MPGQLLGLQWVQPGAGRGFKGEQGSKIRDTKRNEGTDEAEEKEKRAEKGKELRRRHGTATRWQGTDWGREAKHLKARGSRMWRNGRERPIAVEEVDVEKLEMKRQVGTRQQYWRQGRGQEETCEQEGSRGE